MSNEINSPGALLHVLPSTSDEVNRFAKSIADSVRQGEMNPLDVMLQVRAMEKAFKIILDNVKPFAEREAEKYAERVIDYRGNSIEKCDVKTEYDYMTSNDPVYERKLYEFEKASKELEEREAFLKALREPFTIVDDLTGEIVRVSPPLKKTVSGLKFTIK